MTLTQKYQQPIGPSMFSADLRHALVFYGLELTDATGNVSTLLNLDFTGVLEGEVLILKQPGATVVTKMLRELLDLVEQIEDQRN